MEYYQNIITEKSFKELQKLRRRYKFILIGGWAVYLYTHSLKSKDIDIVIDYDELNKLKRNFSVNKNDRLKKYEISREEIDIDIYLPFYSHPGLPAESIEEYAREVEGFLVPSQECLLILKQKAYTARQGTAKGEKDKIDIISLLQNELNVSEYKKILKKFNLSHYLFELKNILRITKEVDELRLNQFRYSKLKKKYLPQLS